MRARTTILAVALVALVLAPGAAHAQLETSKHNLSTSGTGTISSPTESRTCVFCHTPHNAVPVVPLWNHATSAAVYSTYTSTTMAAAHPVGQPTGASKLCLSCHDGTVALGQTVNDGTLPLANTGAGGRMPAGSSNLGIDLRDDHPVSFEPVGAGGGTVDPPPGSPVKLDPAGLVQCTSCHDPHDEVRDPVTRKFLVAANQGSTLCTACHSIPEWAGRPSAHQSSTKAYGAAQGAHTGYTTVRDNGCESCHRPHSGQTPQRLVKFQEEITCDKCHSGAVAAKNIALDFQKTYRHPTYTTTPSVHEASESPDNPSSRLPETNPAAPRHAECFDCHNGHASNAATATAPNVAGSLAGVWGIDASGARVSPAVYEYQICFKCHADSANMPQPSGSSQFYVKRQIVQFNTRLEFDTGAVSHHAVEGPGRSSDVPSLIGYTVTSSIYCSDCHAADAGGARGPHGSNNRHILKSACLPGSPAGGYNPDNFRLCYTCHRESSILGDVTFGEHDKHIRGEDSSCLVCHDPHGISAAQGNTTNNARLINFDTDVVTPSSSGRLEFRQTSPRHGDCYLTCHGKNHNPENY